MAEIPSDLKTRLLRAREKHNVPALVRPLAQRFMFQTLGVLFPHFSESTVCNEQALSEDLIQMAQLLERLERAMATFNQETLEPVAPRFMEHLARVHELLQEDAAAIFEGDPAAKSVDEVILTYPGFFALGVYRVAHVLFNLGLPLLPRLLTEIAHEKTGIDIHPGATIGKRFCIDHGTGVVIGETCFIGSNVKLYQGVTLGALTVEKSLADKKRHPTIEDDVVIYAGATILGGNTVVGSGSLVAGNAWLTQSVPPNSVVSRKSEVRPRGEKGASLEEDWVI
jgi:serine O-acetyltransferase